MLPKLSVTASHPTADVTLVPASAALDGRLSLTARGLLAYLLSFSPEEMPTLAEAAQSGPDDEAALRPALAELQSAGYLTIEG